MISIIMQNRLLGYNQFVTIYLCRHGQNTGDLENRYGGGYDDHLTKDGKEQAKVLGQKLSGKGIEKIFTSPKIRAQETAAILRDILQVEVDVLENFRERDHYGIMTGMVRTEAKEKYPQLVELLKDTRNTIEGGEDYQSFGTRIKEAFNEVVNSGNSTVAVITHGGPIRYLFREILKQGEIDLTEGPIVKLNYQAGQLNLRETEGITLLG